MTSKVTESGACIYGDSAEGGYDAYLARLGAEHITLHADEVAKVKEFLEHGVVHGGILGIGAEGIASYIERRTKTECPI